MPLTSLPLNQIFHLSTIIKFTGLHSFLAGLIAEQSISPCLPACYNIYNCPWERDPLFIVQKAGWASGAMWMGQVNLFLTGFRTLDCQACSELL
jgi:hypothetical protein